MERWKGEGEIGKGNFFFGKGRGGVGRGGKGGLVSKIPVMYMHRKKKNKNEKTDFFRWLILKKKSLRISYIVYLSHPPIKPPMNPKFLSYRYISQLIIQPGQKFAELQPSSSSLGREGGSFAPRAPTKRVPPNLLIVHSKVRKSSSSSTCWVGPPPLSHMAARWLK